jgi:hypothetical protein
MDRMKKLIRKKILKKAIFIIDKYDLYGFATIIPFGFRLK